MKTLILLRHAKSSWKFPDLKDKERPLRKRGIRDARTMSSVLMNKHIPVDCIITSPAERAAATAKSFAEEFRLNGDRLVQNEDLYMESKSRMLSVIQNLNDQFNTVILVSHEPTLTDLANLLMEESIDRIPTTGMVGIEFGIDSWHEAGSVKGKQIFFEVPKTYRKKQSEKDKDKVL